jgi:hypothetical protein
MRPTTLGITCGEEGVKLSVAIRRNGRGGAGMGTGDCESCSVTNGVEGDMKRRGTGGGGPLASPSLGVRLKGLDEPVLDLPNDD